MQNSPPRIFDVAIASGASTSSSLDFGDSSYRLMALRYVTMSTGAAVTVYGCDTVSGTYTKIQEQINSTTVQYRDMTIATTVSGGNWAVFQAPPHRYVQFITSAVVSGGVSFTVLARE